MSAQPHIPQCSSGHPMTPAPIPTSTPRPRPTHCHAGHAFDEANTRYQPSGSRVCRTCAKARAAEHRARANALSVDEMEIDGDGYLDLVAAICRQALADVRGGADDGSGFAFLDAAGLVRADGTIGRRADVAARRAAGTGEE